MTDGFGRNVNYLRMSVTELCNLRCRYCMPAEGVCKKEHAEMLTEEEMITAVEAAASLGITKLRITGGEPLVKKNILSICRRTAAVPGIDEVCVTTNGVLLKDFAENLKKSGVKRLNISLDTLNGEKFSRITRGGNLQAVLSGIDAALSAGFRKIKINAVLIGGFNDDEINELAQLTMKQSVDVRFIELMPMVDTGYKDFDYLPASVVLDRAPGLEPLSVDGVAKLYRLPGAVGNVGLISPVSDNFCDGCNRIRLTADGSFKPCLHAPEEFSVKGMDVTEMMEQFRRAVLAKPRWHGEFSARSKAGRGMNEIGG